MYVCWRSRRSREKGSDCSTKPNICKIHHSNSNSKQNQNVSNVTLTVHPVCFVKVSVHVTPRMASILHVWEGDVGIHHESSTTIPNHPFFNTAVYSVSVRSITICRTYFPAPVIIASLAQDAVPLLYISPTCDRPLEIHCIFHQWKNKKGQKLKLSLTQALLLKFDALILMQNERTNNTVTLRSS